MTAAGLIQSIGSTGLFPSRAFIPAFVTSLLMRFGNDIPFIRDARLLGSVDSTPTWFTHDVTLVILGLLALLEIVATKIPELREAMNEVDYYIKRHGVPDHARRVQRIGPRYAQRDPRRRPRDRLGACRRCRQLRVLARL